jgi:hypothetical protein
MHTDAHKWISDVDSTWDTIKQDKRENFTAFKSVFVLSDSRISIRHNSTGPPRASGDDVISISIPLPIKMAVSCRAAIAGRR